MGNELYAIMLKASKKYDIKLPHNEYKFMKVPYVNNQTFDVTFTIKSSDS